LISKDIPTELVVDSSLYDITGEKLK